MRENYRYPGSYLDDEDFETHISASFEDVDIKTSQNKWTPMYSVEGDKTVFYHINTPEKRLAMIKAYEQL